MLTKGAIGNLVNRYRAVLKKCNLINTFGSLAVASMLVLGGAGVAEAADYTNREITNGSLEITEEVINFNNSSTAVYAKSITTDSTTNIIIGSDNSVVSIQATYIGLRVNNVDDRTNTTDTAKITVNGDSLTITAVGQETFAAVSVQGQVGPGTSTAPNPKWDSAVNGDLTVDKRGSIALNSKTTTIKGFDTAFFITGTGQVDVNGDMLVVEASDNIADVRGHSILNINSKVAQLKGDIQYGYNHVGGGDYAVDSIINLNLSGENSYWEGAAKLTWSQVEGEEIPLEDLKVNTLNVTLADGAKWIPTKLDESNINTNKGSSRIPVNNLNLDDGIVVIKAGVEADVETLSGKGDVRVDTTGESMGTLTAANAADATLDVQAADADGNALNADQTDAETLKKVKAQVKAEGATVTASAAEGDVNGAITVAADGSTSTAKNTLMDAALKQASITTVSLDRILTNDVRKRLGDIRADQNTTGVWMRWDGGRLKNSGLTNDFNTIQIGGDTKVAKNCRLGVAGSFTHGEGDFARGSSELEGFSFAAYATWMGENGMFADVVARLGHFSTEMKVEGREGDMNNRVASLSGEYGWRFNVCEQFFIEPQVELAYTYVSSEDLELGAAKYSFDNVDSLTGRAGLVAGWNLPNDRGNLYARASVVQQFMGDAKISGMKGDIRNIQEIDGEDTWLEYGIGANIKLTDKTYIWADVERTEGAEIDEEWRGTVGVRFSF